MDAKGAFGQIIRKWLDSFSCYFISFFLESLKRTKINTKVVIKMSGSLIGVFKTWEKKVDEKHKA